MNQKNVFKDFKPQRALISVSDKSEIVTLCFALNLAGVELIATGNTAALLRQEGLPVTDVSQLTGFPEMMDGRVKTLHPAIHAGILAREQDQNVLSQHGIKRIDLVIVNLYPFQEVTSKPQCEFTLAIENIDIGGPSLIRAAAKNHANTFVLVSKEDYPVLIDALCTKKVPKDWGLTLAKKAFAHTSAYDAAISNFLNRGPESIFPEVFTCQYTKQSSLRYGENPHQQALFYRDNEPASSLGHARLIQGKPLSYNNILDADAALNTAKSFPEESNVAVIVKHTNPSGIATARDQMSAYLRAFESDPISAFGGIIAFNHPLESQTARLILDKQFVEVIIAPGLSPDAKEILLKKPNVRVLITGNWQKNQTPRLNLKTVDGGLLLQEEDTVSMIGKDFEVVTKQGPTTVQREDLLFAWLAAKHVKSNAIVYAKEGATLGIGGGQSSRVMSARIGLWQAKESGFNLKGAVMASDAFIPFVDTLELAAAAGISAVIQPGGSIRDKELIEYANSENMIMVFTGTRHFKH